MDDIPYQVMVMVLCTGKFTDIESCEQKTLPTSLEKTF